jgi:hypothetical protein
MNFNIFDSSDAQLILLDVIDSVLRINYGSDFKRNAKGYNFKCDKCGDSEKRTHLKRGWVLTSKWPYMRYCHNCRISYPATMWLKEKYPDFHREYTRRVLESSSPNKKRKIKKEDFSHLTFSELSQAETINATNLAYYFENFKNMINHPDNKDMQYFSKLTPEAIDWCEGRKIPKDVYSKWFFSQKGMYKNRVVIPFYDTSNRMYYYQTRTIGHSTKKYLNPVSEIKPMYNILNVNISEPIIFVEGVIDSLFVNNSVAINGAKLSALSSLNIPKNNMYFLCDNDKTGKEVANELLQEGHKVFLWKKFYKDTYYDEEKDINSLILTNNLDDLKTDGLLNYFSDNIMHRALI